MQTDIDPRSLIGRKAFDRDGVKIGTVDEVYLDDATGEPEWAAVRTGLFGRDAFVPLEPSRVEEDGLRIPYERALIRQAPGFGVGRHLSPAQELRLYRHYGLELPSPEPPPEPPAPDGTAAGEAPSGGPEGVGGASG
ncbi:PRC-barrel domain-containing protein [Streptomyces sp. NPDC001678]|uniref:PRC-barrel domain-containing protein n=1 Tax=Streptomyces sp. NPDC001678 TaxID=3364599 RepID=UPI003691A840